MDDKCTSVCVVCFSFVFGPVSIQHREQNEDRPSFQMNKLIRTNAQNKWIFLDNVIKSNVFDSWYFCRWWPVNFSSFVMVIAIIVFQFSSGAGDFFYLFYFSCVFCRSSSKDLPHTLTIHFSPFVCLCVCMPFKKQHSSNYFERKEMTIESIMSRHWRLQKTSIVVFNVLKKIPSMDLRNGQKSSCNIWLRHSICRELVSESSVCVCFFFVGAGTMFVFLFRVAGFHLFIIRSFSWRNH